MLKKRVLVIAAHPDDEVLGCGGTIAKHADNGDEINILIVSEGSTSRQTKRDPKSASKELNSLKKSATLVASFLGANSNFFGFTR